MMNKEIAKLETGTVASWLVGSSLDQVLAVDLLLHSWEDTLLSQFLSPNRCINEYQCNSGGNRAAVD